MDKFHKALSERREEVRTIRRESIAREKSHQRTEWTLFIVAVVAIILLLLQSMQIQRNNALDQCIKKGFAENVCKANL